MSVSLFNGLSDPVFDCVGPMPFSIVTKEQGQCLFIGLAARSFFVFCCFLYLFFHSMGLCCGVGVVGLTTPGLVLPALHYQPFLIIILIIIIITVSATSIIYVLKKRKKRSIPRPNNFLALTLLKLLIFTKYIPTRGWIIITSEYFSSSEVLLYQ